MHLRANLWVNKWLRFDPKLSKSSQIHENDPRVQKCVEAVITDNKKNIQDLNRGLSPAQRIAVIRLVIDARKRIKEN